jgi:hypothetical protein
MIASGTVWDTTCYFLWHQRNKRMHDHNFLESSQPWRMVKDYVEAYENSTSDIEDDSSCTKRAR